MDVSIYSRVSSDAQDVELSIGAQVRALRDYAVKHGYRIVREFTDEAMSGRSDARPAFKEMISLAKTRPAPFEAILVWKLNRFARSRLDSAVYKKLLKDRGIKVISINEPLEDSPTGHLTEGMIEAIDQFYSENMGQDIKRGLRESARRGFFTGSLPPYGMHKVPIKDGNKTRYKLEPDPHDSTPCRVVHRIFDLAQSGQGCKAIAKALNNEGLRTGTGNRWGVITVHKVLNNEAYSGTLVLGGRPGHRAIRSGVEPVRVENAWPAIIDRDVFFQVQSMMADKRPRIVHPRTVSSNYLLSGLLFCSSGHAMTGRSAKSHQYYYYTCNGKVKQGKETCDARPLAKDKLERAIVEKIKEKVLNEEWLEELVVLLNKELDSAHSALGDKLQAIDADLREVGLKLSRLYDAIETGKVSLDDLGPRIKEQRIRESELSKIRLRIEAEMLVKGPNHVDKEAVINQASDLKSILEEGDTVTSKAFLKTFIKRVEIDGNEAKVTYTLPMPPQSKTSDRVSVLPIETPGGECALFVTKYCNKYAEIVLRAKFHRLRDIRQIEANTL